MKKILFVVVLSFSFLPFLGTQGCGENRCLHKMTLSVKVPFENMDLKKISAGRLTPVGTTYFEFVCCPDKESVERGLSIKKKIESTYNAFLDKVLAGTVTEQYRKDVKYALALGKKALELVLQTCPDKVAVPDAGTKTEAKNPDDIKRSKALKSNTPEKKENHDGGSAEGKPSEGNPTTSQNGPDNR